MAVSVTLSNHERPRLLVAATCSRCNVALPVSALFNAINPSTSRAFCSAFCIAMSRGGCGTVGPNARVAPVDRENKLFVGMLPHDADDMTLTEVFSGFGEITEVSRLGGCRQQRLGCHPTHHAENVMPMVFSLFLQGFSRIRSSQGNPSRPARVQGLLTRPDPSLDILNTS